MNPDSLLLYLTLLIHSPGSSAFNFLSVPLTSCLGPWFMLCPLPWMLLFQGFQQLPSFHPSGLSVTFSPGIQNSVSLSTPDLSGLKQWDLFAPQVTDQCGWGVCVCVSDTRMGIPLCFTWPPCDPSTLLAFLGSSARAPAFTWWEIGNIWSMV